MTVPSGGSAAGTDEITIIAETTTSRSSEDTDRTDIFLFDPDDVEQTGEDPLIVDNGKGPDVTPDERQLVVAIKWSDGNGNDGNDNDVFFRELCHDTTSDAGKHTYISGGIYTITVTIIDDDTGQAVDSADAFFSEYGGAESGAPWTFHGLTPGYQYN